MCYFLSSQGCGSELGRVGGKALIWDWGGREHSQSVGEGLAVKPGNLSSTPRLLHGGKRELTQAYVHRINNQTKTTDLGGKLEVQKEEGGGRGMRVYLWCTNVRIAEGL